MRRADRLWPDWTLRALLFAALWLVISGGEPGSWLIGLPAVAFATWAVGRLGESGHWRLSVSSLVRFVAFFLRESVRGGVDVAGRTLRPTLRIRPGYITHASRLPSGTPTLLFASCVSLLPGTLTAELDGTRLTVHVLDRDAPVQEEIADLERRIADVFRANAGASHA